MFLLLPVFEESPAEGKLKIEKFKTNSHPHRLIHDVHSSQFPIPSAKIISLSILRLCCTELLTENFMNFHSEGFTL